MRSRSTTRFTRPSLRHILPLFLLVICCSNDDNGVEPNDRLCNGEAGLGARIQGRAEPVEFCLDDEDVSVLLTAADRYDIAGQISTMDGVFQIRMVFAMRSDFPVTLTPTSTLNDALADAGKVFIRYDEIPAGGDAVESASVSGGPFRLSFSDENVLTGTMQGITLTLRDVSSGDPAGTRRISEGFFSLSVKSPTVLSPGIQRTGWPPGVPAGR